MGNPQTLEELARQALDGDGNALDSLVDLEHLRRLGVCRVRLASPGARTHR
jgi:hypothetical protein